VISPDNILRAAQQSDAKFRKLIGKLKKADKRVLDEKVHGVHRELFAKYNCLECANCCKNLGPRLTNHDISRLAGYLKLKDADFTQKYLRIDEDNDYVFQSMPCPFLSTGNYCAVYNHRPKACREYPHTDRSRFYQILDLSLLNTAVCPVVYEIFDSLNENEK